MNFHALAGLPRSGSTLLANVLSQHPDIYVSGTSPLCPVFTAGMVALNSQDEVVAQMANVPGSREGYVAGLKGLIDGWYSFREEPIIIDKGRGWIEHAISLTEIVPDAKIIAMVRDPRDVVASIEKQHRKTGLFPSHLGPTLYEMAENLMMPDGMVGAPIRLIEDSIRRGMSNLVCVRYETFVMSPQSALGSILDQLGIESFDFDVNNVDNVAPDLDPLYRGKFPHEGSGAIKPQTSSWVDVIDADLAGLIAGRWPFYMQTFGYQ